MKRLERGLAMVEFALVGPVAFMVLFGCIEIGRMLFVWNTITEATRRGARLAAVTTSDAAGQTAVENAVLAYGNLDNLGGNITVTYYDQNGVTPPTTTTAFVTVRISGLTHSLLIPFVGQDIPVPAFATTLPTESLGIPPP